MGHFSSGFGVIEDAESISDIFRINHDRFSEKMSIFLLADGMILIHSGAFFEVLDD